ncbi:hypothetical protein [Caballeronia sordidicola]|nr:hypothetical protein [Caballeronia sordidicola]
MDLNILLVEVTSGLFDESRVARVDNQVAILSELIEETFRFEVGVPLQLDIVNYDVRLRDNYDGRSTGVIVAVNWL